MKEKVNICNIAEKNMQIFTIIVSVFFMCFSLNSHSYTLDSPSAWMQVPLNKIDELNKKDPALALAFAKKLMNEHKQKMTDVDKASLFSKMAQHNYILGHYNISQGYLDQAYALKVDLTTDVGISVLLTQGGIMDELGNSEQAMERYSLAAKYAKVN